MGRPFIPDDRCRHTIALAACLVTACLVTTSVTAQEAAGVVGEPQVNPLSPTYPDDAYVLSPGVLQLETGYALSFFEDPIPTRGLWDIDTALGVAELVEVRLGWDVLGSAGGRSGVGDLRLGLKGGFFGGIDEKTALAGLFEMQLPTGQNDFGLGSGIRFFGGLVATTELGPVQLDFQAALDTHLFRDDPTFFTPLAVGVTYVPLDWLRVYGDLLVALDLQDVSETPASGLLGIGYRVLPQLEVNSGVRIGISNAAPDAVVEIGVAWRVGDLF